MCKSFLVLFFKKELLAFTVSEPAKHWDVVLERITNVR
jgi:hypothetical protein